eukprot:SAG31_NODE_1720_length_7455_cov_3.242115_5_plen_177_part_00
MLLLNPSRQCRFVWCLSQAVATAQADSNAPKTLSEWLEQWGGGRNDSQAATRRGGVRRSSVRSKFGSLSSTNSKFSFGRHAPTPRHLGPAAIRREARLAANEVRRARPAGRRPPPPSDYKTGRNGEDLSVLPLITLRGQLADDLVRPVRSSTEAKLRHCHDDVAAIGGLGQCASSD